MMGYGRGSGFNNMMNDGWGTVLWLLFGALVIAGVVLLVLWAVRTSKGNSAGTGPTAPPQAAGHDEAVAVARRRLASGEITKEEYDQIMGVLGG